MKYLRNILLMILAVALIMPSPLVLAEGVSSATQESKVDDVTENSSMDSPSENPDTNESSKSEPNPESEPPKIDKSDERTEENATILISKISQDKKYIEIYNPTNQNVNLAGWKIEYYAGSGAKTVGKIFKDEQG